MYLRAISLLLTFRLIFKDLTGNPRFSDNTVQREMARIVTVADFKDQVDNDPAPPGLQLLSFGFPLVTRADHETAERAAFLYDAFYASIETKVTPE